VELIRVKYGQFKDLKIEEPCLGSDIKWELYFYSYCKERLLPCHNAAFSERLAGKP